jgi:cellulose synthase/poly-beta-1,6-N-acetylglucosamine synthase-like glycosyltransferase
VNPVTAIDTSALLKFLWLALVLELPVYTICFVGVLFHGFKERFRDAFEKRRMDDAGFLPCVSCIVTCYSEGRDVGTTIQTLLEQIYPGVIEILVVVDGAVQNRETYRAAREWQASARAYPRRRLEILPKRTRGGRVSSLNTGRQFARGEIVLALDGDTSFDNDMVWQITRPFADPGVAAVSGALRVRNAATSLVARLQALEYMLTIQFARTGLTTLNTVNNVSGAFGAFRRDLLERLSGWDAGTAEDLDLTLRIKKRFGADARFRIAHQPRAIGHTDVPTSWRAFFRQRLRWDGDLYYLYVRKHWRSLKPGLLGWPNFLMLMWTGLYFQLLLPFVVVAATVWLLVTLPFPALLFVGAVTYSFYLLLTLLLFVTYALVLSERQRDDWPYLRFVPLFPFYTFATRVWNAFATLAEALAQQHLDSSMAPWWVLKKTRF